VHEANQPGFTSSVISLAVLANYFFPAANFSFYAFLLEFMARHYSFIKKKEI
jgi:hypothetical protein